MASVRKRTWRSGGQEKTAWVVDYFDQEGKRRLKTCRTKKEADEFRTTCSWEIKQGIHTPASTSITVAEAVAMWLEHGEAEGLEAGTLRTYDRGQGTSSRSSGSTGWRSSTGRWSSSTETT